MPLARTESAAMPAVGVGAGAALASDCIRATSPGLPLGESFGVTGWLVSPLPAQKVMLSESIRWSLQSIWRRSSCSRGAAHDETTRDEATRVTAARRLPE